MYRHYVLTFLICFFGMLLGIVLRHYLDERIPFDKIFEKIECFINRFVNCLYRLKHNRLVQFVGRTIKNCIFGIFKVVKWFGNLIYKNRVAIGKNILNCAIEVKKTINGEDLAEYQIDNSLMLVEDEEESFTKQFEGHPYDTPSVVVLPVQEGVAWYDLQAIGLVSRYEKLSSRNLTRMAETQIQKYMKETRKTNVDIFVKMATPKRLYFGIALSKHGQKELAKERQNQVSVMTEEAPPPLEEEIIDLFSVKEGEKL